MTSKDFESKEHQHIRYNPLKGEWILVSPHRCQRPWQGKVEEIKSEEIPEFDPANPLCPNATRPNGNKNPDYKSTFVFDNDFPALLEDVPEPPGGSDPLFQMKGARGKCKVMCFHPKSNITLPFMTIDEIMAVIERWIIETKELGEKYTWVQIFENKGDIMGCSNPHPHCQVWASTYFPNEPRIKDKYLKEYYDQNKSPLLVDYVTRELAKNERIVYQNDDWVVLVPFWATWPYETMILPKNRENIQRFTDLEEGEKINLAQAIKILTIKYDNLFQTSFPYTMGWHGAPTGQFLTKDNSHWTFHGIYMPPLLRSASIRKYAVGYEMLAQIQRDLTPEQAAEKLRDLPQVHYTLSPK